jgi:hypothetical protein
LRRRRRGILDTPLKKGRLVVVCGPGRTRFGVFSFRGIPVHGILVVIVEVLANRVHLLVESLAHGGGVSFSARDATDEGRIDRKASGDAAEEAAKNGKRGERSRAIIRLVTIHDTFQEHGS